MCLWESITFKLQQRGWSLPRLLLPCWQVYMCTCSHPLSSLPTFPLLCDIPKIPSPECHWCIVWSPYHQTSEPNKPPVKLPIPRLEQYNVDLGTLRFLCGLPKMRNPSSGRSTILAWPLRRSSEGNQWLHPDGSKEIPPFIHWGLQTPCNTFLLSFFQIFRSSARPGKPTWGAHELAGSWTDSLERITLTVCPQVASWNIKIASQGNLLSSWWGKVCETQWFWLPSFSPLLLGS